MESEIFCNSLYYNYLKNSLYSAFADGVKKAKEDLIPILKQNEKELQQNKQELNYA